MERPAFTSLLCHDLSIRPLSSLVLLFPCWCKYFRCFSQLSGLLRLNLSVFFSHLFSCPCSEQVLPGFSFFFVISIVALLRLVSPIPTTAFFEFVFASLTLWSDVFAQNIWSLWPTCAPLEGSKNFSSLFVACFWTQEIPHSLLLDLIHQRFKKKITADDLKGMMAISALCAWEILQYLSLIFNEKSGGFCVGRDWQVVFVVKMR